MQDQTQILNEILIPPKQRQEIVLRAGEATVVQFLNERGDELARVEFDPDLYGDDPNLCFSCRAVSTALHDLDI